MNTFWLKIAGLAIAIVVIIVLISTFTSSSTQEPQQPRKTFYDVAEQDRQKFLAKPQPPAEGKTETERIASARELSKPPEEAGPVTLYFRELSEIERIEAEKLLNTAVPGRSIGRLPMTGFKLMVDCCRQIIQRWPDSWYAYRAKQMLADMPPRFRKRYRITEEELDLSRFAEPRPGTKPFIIKESR